VATRLPSHFYIPVRRMFAARPPDELRGRNQSRTSRARAFPFPDVGVRP
jgi:hypothetical protein